MAETVSASTAAGGLRWARVALIVAAGIELFGAVRDWPILAGDLNEIPGPGLGGWIITAKIAVQPILAALALAFAIKGRLPAALLAFAAMIAMTWLSYLPSVAIHGLEFKGDGAGGLFTLFQIILAPLIALIVAVFAIRRERIEVATALAIAPTIIGVLAIAAFGIGVAIYGF